MRVFITWSGEKSRQVGEVFRHWLPSVLQAVRPYFSPDDIAKGSLWFSEIAAELNDAKYGIICVTPENSEKPWLNFEAGALSKGLGKPNVCPILFGIGQADIRGPLSHFQSAKFERDEIQGVISSMNELLADRKLPADVLSNVFEMWWPELNRAVSEVLAREAPAERRPRAERDILEEVLEIVRAMAEVSKSSLDRDRFVESLISRQLAELAKRSEVGEVVLREEMRSLRDRLPQRAMEEFFRERHYPPPPPSVPAPHPSDHGAPKGTTGGPDKTRHQN